MKFLLIAVLGICCLLMIKCTEVEISPIDKVPEEGLLAYYSFSGTAMDESGNQHDGNIFGAQLKTDSLRNGTQSILFDGIDDYIELDSMDSFNASLESFSISFWIKADSIGVDVFESIMKTTNNAGAGTMFSIEIHRGASAVLDIGVIRLDLRDNTDKDFSIIVHRPDVFDNEWHNITFVLSSAKNNQGDVFIDGELESKDDFFVKTSSQSPSEFSLFDHPLTLGAGNNRGTIVSYFKGSLDEIAFYNRRLTTKEILQLFNRVNIKS